MIPFLDLRAAYVELKSEIDEAIQRSLSSGYYIGGAEVEAFESDFAAYCEADHCASVGNGLDALTLALRALEIGPGDEVVVPSNTFIATWLAVSQCGATPVGVEPRADTCNIDPDRIEAVISPRTKAIIVVHLYGQPADLDPILTLAGKRGLRVIEDAAQAHGASYKGRRIGAHSDAVTWSFYPGKNLGGFGDGGAVTTRDQQTHERIKLLRNYGSKVKYVHEVQGVNSRLDPIQAAVLGVKLRYLDAWNDRRRSIAGLYLAGLQQSDRLIRPVVPAWAEPAWHLFVVRSPERDRLQRDLEAAGIHTLIHYPSPPHRQQAYVASFADDHAEGDSFPIATQMGREVLSLPIGPHVTAESAQYVIESINRLALA